MLSLFREVDGIRLFLLPYWDDVDGRSILLGIICNLDTIDDGFKVIVTAICQCLAILIGILLITCCVRSVVDRSFHLGYPIPDLDKLLCLFLVLQQRDFQDFVLLNPFPVEFNTSKYLFSEVASLR